jgi:hypothetical protein
MRLGIILFGFGLLLWGLYIHKKYEGFQISVNNMAMTPSMPNMANLPAPPTPKPVAPETSSGNEEIIKDSEIRSKFKLIMANKSSMDPILTKYLINTEDLSKMLFLYNEVKDYTENPMNIRATIERGVEKDINIMKQIIYNAHYNVDILYKVYFAIPSLVISSNTIITSDTASDLSIFTEDVIAKSIPNIRAELTGIPTAIEQFSSISSTFMSDTLALQKNNTAVTLNNFRVSMSKYLKITDMVIASFDLRLNNLSMSKQTSTITEGTNAKLSFVEGVSKTLSSIHEILSKIREFDQNTLISIQSRISQYNMVVGALQDTLKPEGFQSYTNPYDSASPNLTQAREFRLSKSSYNNDILTNIKA